MDSLSLELGVIVVLIIANGLFSMAEMAIVSARKARLQQQADEGKRGAEIALKLADDPSDFLSTIQVGITLIGTLAGAFGGATVAERFSAYLQSLGVSGEWSGTASMAVVVGVISYFSLVLGELVPKTLALSQPEAIAARVAPPMLLLSRIGLPVVRLLTLSTNAVVRLIPIKLPKNSPVTEEEIRLLVEQGAEHGAIGEAEQTMVEGVFRLGDRKVSELMKPRGKVTWLDVEDSWSVNRAIVVGSPYSRFPVAAGGIDNLIGLIHVRDLVAATDSQRGVDLRKCVAKPLIIPEVATALEALETMQQAREEMAFVVDEHGDVQGLVTVSGLLDAVVGALRDDHADGSPWIKEAANGDLIVDGACSVSDVAERLGIRELPAQEKGFATIAGYMLSKLRRIPSPGDSLSVEDLTLEVTEMERNRIATIRIQTRGKERGAGQAPA